VYEQVKMIRQKPETVAWAATCAVERLITVHTLSVSDAGEKEQRLHFVIRVPDASLTDINAGMSFYICQDNLFI
jgi:hypothetical protein